MLQPNPWRKQLLRMLFDQGSRGEKSYLFQLYFEERKLITTWYINHLHPVRGFKRMVWRHHVAPFMTAVITIAQDRVWSSCSRFCITQGWFIRLTPKYPYPATFHFMQFYFFPVRLGYIHLSFMIVSHADGSGTRSSVATCEGGKQAQAWDTSSVCLEATGHLKGMVYIFTDPRLQCGMRELYWQSCSDSVLYGVLSFLPEFGLDFENTEPYGPPFSI